MNKNTVNFAGFKFVLPLLFLFAGNLQAQEKYFFEQISVSDGLSNSVVISTHQDHLGYLWIGTIDGLNRYDGYTIKTYKNVPNDSTTLPYNNVSSIYEDSQNRLWVSTNDEVSIYDRQQENFTSYPLDRGPNINNTTVTHILEDSKNRLWMTTAGIGIQLFDPETNTFNGIHFTDYSNNTVFNYSDINFQSIFELKNGNVLAISPEHGVFAYNASANEFQPYFPTPELNQMEVGALFEDRTGKLWFGGRDNLYIYEPSTFSMRTIDLEEVFPTQGSGNIYGFFYEEGINKILFSSFFGVIETNLEASSFSLISEEVDNMNVNSIYRDNFGIYWFSTIGNGLYKLDPTKKSFQFYPVNEEGSTGRISEPVAQIVQNTRNRNELLFSIVDRGIYSYNYKSENFTKIQDESSFNLVSDSDGNLWFTQDNALIKRDMRTGNTESFTFPDLNFTRSFDHFNLKFGPDKKLWIPGTRGIETFDPDTKQFDRLPSIMNRKVSEDLLTKIRSLATTQEPLASILEVGEGKTLSKEFILNDPAKVLVLNLGEGRLTLAASMFDFGSLENSRGEKLWASDSTSNTFHHGGGFKNRISMETMELPAGTYTIHYQTDIGHNYGNFNVEPPLDSTWYGIQVFALDSNEYAALDQQINEEMDDTYYPPFEVVNDIEFSEKYVRSAWVASGGTGLVRINLTDFSYKKYNINLNARNFDNLNFLYDILEDKDGIVWINSDGGLVRFDPETETFELIDQQYGLSSNTVIFMIEDLDSNLWIGTPGGISMLDKSNKSSSLSFINYDNTDGINSLPMNSSSLITDEGKIFYGGNGGLNAFFPGSTNKTLSQTIITELLLSGESVSKIAPEIGLETNIGEAKNITLPFKYNNLAFEFASIHFSRPSKNKLAYMLVGIDEEWNTSNRRFASYLNLSPGNYEFKIRGSNGDGVWNPEITSLKISITPPWWRTWWAYLLYGIIILFLLWKLHTFQKERTLRMERQKTQQRELEQAREIEKAYTELKATQNQLVQQEKLASLGQLTAGIAHEIKNPLNFVNNFSDLNLELISEVKELNIDHQELNELLDSISANTTKIHEHGSRADSIVKSMLQHSSGSNGEKKSVKLNPFIKEFVNLSFHGMRAGKDPINIDIHYELDESIGEVSFIAEDFSRVIINLANNAFDAMRAKLMEDGGPETEEYTPKLTVRTAQENGKVLIEIEDNGPGIPEEIQDQILQPFFTTKKGTEGTGLGLSITHDIIKAHGGALMIQSKKGDGTSFIITLIHD